MVDDGACAECWTDLNPTITIGLREEPRPKGSGYLYWRLEPGGAEIVIRYCDLFDLREDVVESHFENVLRDVMGTLQLTSAQLGDLCIFTENMSPLARAALERVRSRVA